MKARRLLASLMIFLQLVLTILGSGLPVLAQEDEQPRPYIDNVYPSSGPVAGGTTVIITGLHFGNEIENVKVTLYNEKYQVGREQEVVSVSERAIQFKTIPWEPFDDQGEDDSDAARLMDVIVEIGSKERSATKKNAFVYLIEQISEPVIEDFSPDGGGASGGTQVRITGNYFLTGKTDDDSPIYPDVYFGDVKVDPNDIIPVSVEEIIVKAPLIGRRLCSHQNR